MCRARDGHLVLCGSTPWHQEIFELFRGPELFTIVAAEADIPEGLSDPEPLPDQDPPGPQHSRQMRNKASVLPGADSSNRREFVPRSDEKQRNLTPE